jgi:hypothetical protein
MALDQDKLLEVIDTHITNAYGGEQDTALAQHRAALIEAYLGYNTNPAPEGRSQIVDRSVFESVMSALPSLVRIFAGSEEVVKFLPVGPEDEGAAEQTTAYVSWLVTQQNSWEQICADAIMDALVLPNAYVMAYWDDSERVDREQYEGQTDAQLAILVNDESVEVLEHSQQPDVEQDQMNAQQYQQAMMQYQQAAQMAQQQAMQTGMPPQLPPPPDQPKPAFLHDVVLERSDKKGKLKICVLPPEHCMVAESTPDWTLRDCPFFEYFQSKTLAEIRSMGFDIPDDISDSDDIDTEEGDARDRFAESSWAEDAQTAENRKVTVRMGWINGAIEDDKPRYYRYIRIGRTILYAEPCSRIHVVSLVTQPMPHRHPGMPMAEIVKSVQDVKTAIRRGALDNLYLANNGRFAISDKVNLDDFLDSRPGGVVRLMDGALPGEGHVFPLQHPFAFDSIISALEYFDQDRQNSGGVNRYFSGTDAGAINKTATGVMQLTNQSAQRVEHIARMMAPAFEDLFAIVHELICKHQNKKEVIQLRGQWVEIDPTAWKTRRDVKISVGVGAGNKDSMLANLQMLIQAQMALAPMGIANPENVYNALTEQLKLQGFSNPAKFLTDPKKNPPKPQIPPEIQVEQMRLQADQQKFQSQAQLDQQKMQQEAQKAQQQAQIDLTLEREKAEQQAALEKYKADLQAQTQLQIEQMRLGGQVQIKEAELGLQREVKGAEIQSSREMAHMQAATGQQSEAKVSGMIEKLSESMEEAKSLMKASRRIKRGKDGKVEGVEVVSPTGEVIASKGVVRGPDGRVAGLQ